MHLKEVFFSIELDFSSTLDIELNFFKQSCCAKFPGTSDHDNVFIPSSERDAKQEQSFFFFHPADPRGIT